ncbi:uncharacterized protein LOC115634809 [Scaptodrosophila lebanonensis]|uniref:Uncharacterized protein LOC115634809 n=1 Tax=Drosophila lebanonensis TaxID=7225 RepID=A0A6J2UJJ9_DROLE|nr:uncharacterized protein LOC115634809 [Scaptodrosophila lebanonensis]
MRLTQFNRIELFSMVTRFLVALALLGLRAGFVWTQQSEESENAPLPTPFPKPGRYVPELHGATRGRYVPDLSGKYRHVHRPYDGGYGDRGEPYVNIRGDYPTDSQQLMLGPRDHLRFMIDFNLNGTGWQIIQFEWVRDGEESEQRKFNYVNENKLWGTDSDSDLHSDPSSMSPSAYDYKQPQANVETVRVAGEYDQNRNDYQVSYRNEPAPQQSVSNAGQDPTQIQEAIDEVLEYIQQHILPTLK